MRFGSVCSGVEAASLAWGPLGWRAAWFSEIEPFPCAVLAHHFPDVPNLGDMTRLPELIRSGEVEAPDLLCGGTPCQAFSVAGQRRSLDDARGNLSLVFCEILNAIDDVRSVRGIEPAIAFWENVPGVLSTKDNALGCFLGELAGADAPLTPGTKGDRWPTAGYVAGPKRQIAWRVLDAQHFGVPQRRRRIYVIASARWRFDPSKILFERQGVCGNPETGGGKRKDASGGAEGGARADACYGFKSYSEYVMTNVSPTLKVRDGIGKDGTSVLCVEHGFREGSFGSFVKTKVAGTCKARGGFYGGGDETLVIEK